MTIGINVDYTGDMSNQSLEEKVYQIRDQLSTTQMQVNALSSFQLDVKEGFKTLVSDVKSIGADIHKLGLVAAKIEPIKEDLETQKKELEDLKSWKIYTVAVASASVIVMGLVEIFINLYVK